MEIGEMLEISTGTSKWHLSYARKKLKEMMQELINATKVILIMSNLDQFFKDKFQNREFEFKEEYWQQAQDLIQRDRQHRRRRRWYFGLFALLLAGGLGYWIFQNQSPQKSLDQALVHPQSHAQSPTQAQLSDADPQVLAADSQTINSTSSSPSSKPLNPQAPNPLTRNPEPQNPQTRNLQPINSQPANPQAPNPLTRNPEPQNSQTRNLQPINSQPANPQPQNPLTRNPEPQNSQTRNLQPINSQPANPQPQNPLTRNPKPNNTNNTPIPYRKSTENLTQTQSKPQQPTNPQPATPTPHSVISKVPVIPIASITPIPLTHENPTIQNSETQNSKLTPGLTLTTHLYPAKAGETWWIGGAVGPTLSLPVGFAFGPANGIALPPAERKF